jgi:hypothetical protein
MVGAVPIPRRLACMRVNSALPAVLRTLLAPISLTSCWMRAWRLAGAG